MEILVHKCGYSAEIRNYPNGPNLRQSITEELKKIGIVDFYLSQNGKLVQNFPVCQDDVPIFAISRLVGGKGGFGSMLRAIGAQIEKTTNRDACRDLSGRRLRDINEEQRLKRWFAKQSEREEEKKEAKKRKLEKLKKITEGPPLPKVDDPEYNKQRAEMSDKVYEAVDYGFEASGSSSKQSVSSAADPVPSSDSNSNDSSEGNAPVPSSSKVLKEDDPGPKPKKMKKFLMDEDLDSDCSSDSDSCDQQVAKATA